MREAACGSDLSWLKLRLCSYSFSGFQIPGFQMCNLLQTNIWMHAQHPRPHPPSSSPLNPRPHSTCAYTYAPSHRHELANNCSRMHITHNHTHTRAHTHARMRTHTRTHLHQQLPPPTHTIMHMFAQMCTHKHTSAHVRTSHSSSPTTSPPPPGDSSSSMTTLNMDRMSTGPPCAWMPARKEARKPSTSYSVEAWPERGL